MKKNSSAAASNAADDANGYTGADCSCETCNDCLWIHKDPKERNEMKKSEQTGGPERLWGRKVAMCGISGMDAESKGTEDVESFMEECKRNGKDPIDVVSFIASHQCIDPSRGQPYDRDDRRLFDLIVGVINRVYGRDVFSEGACEGDDDQDDVSAARPSHIMIRRKIRMPRLRLARCAEESDPRHPWGWMGVFLKDLMDM